MERRPVLQGPSIPGPGPHGARGAGIGAGRLPFRLLGLRFVAGHPHSPPGKTETQRLLDVLGLHRPRLLPCNCMPNTAVLVLKIVFWVQQQSEGQFRVYAHAGRKELCY